MKTQGQHLRAFYLHYRKDKKALTRRAFAIYTGIDPARMHDYMTDKRLMTMRIAEQICLRLKLPAGTANTFRQDIQAQRSRKKRSKTTVRLSQQEFARISEWHYFAILALMDTVGFKSDIDDIARRLCIHEAQVQEALSTLADLNLVKLVNGEYLLSHVDVETESDIPSAVLRMAHKQSLHRVLEFIDTIDVDQREVQSVIFAGDPKKLKLAKTLISQLTQKIVALLESGHRTEVFEMTVQLMPVTQTKPF